jgi:metallo-beta-lactamase family protein
VKLEFLGAVRTVTGSMHRVEANGASLLLDCGLYQGRRQESYDRNSHFEFAPQSIEALVLSHAHMDHAGNIPTLVRDGFSGNIFTTSATRDLASAMLLDSGHIQEQDASYLNKSRAARGEAPVKPLYTVADAMACMGSFVGLGYGRPLPVIPGVRATFHDAGHILGSAIVALDLQEGERKLRLAYTGDLGPGHMPILREPTVVQDVDALIIESTYGNRVHEPLQSAEDKLQQIVVQTWQRGGKLIVPAFAVGRTQTLVYTLNQLMQRHGIPNLPIFVDSPLAVNVTEIFRLHPECYNAQTAQFLVANGDPFGFERLTYVRSVEDSKELNFLREPAIIISASGMAENGRILHHLKNNISDPRNTVLLVGYQAENTLGRKLEQHLPQVPILGEMVPLRAQVEEIDGYSAHADRDGLLNWVKAVRGERLKRVFVVHGEEDQGQALADALRALGGLEVTLPEPGQVVDLS